MSQSVEGPNKSFKSTNDLSAKQYYIVKTDADGSIVLAAAATDLTIVGVLQNEPKANEAATVALRSGGGTTKVIAGGTLNRGDHVTTDSAGKAVATTTADDEVIGRAVEGAVSNDIFEIMPATYKYAIT